MKRHIITTALISHERVKRMFEHCDADRIPIRANAERFSEANFINGLTASIARCIGT